MVPSHAFSARVYREPAQLSEDEIAACLLSGIPRRCGEALLSVVLYGSDRRAAEDLCARFLSGDDVGLRCIAATCVGHIARIHGTLDRARLVPMLESLKEDPSVGGCAEDALDDIEIYTASRMPDGSW